MLSFNSFKENREIQLEESESKFEDIEVNIAILTNAEDPELRKIAEGLSIIDVKK